MKTALDWLRTHSLRLLGFTVLLVAAVLLWLGQISIDQAAGAVAAGLALLGLKSTIDRAILAAIAKSGSDYRAGNRAAAVTDLKPLALEGVALASQAAPLAITLSGEPEHVLAAATALQATPAVKG